MAETESSKIRKDATAESNPSQVERRGHLFRRQNL